MQITKMEQETILNIGKYKVRLRFDDNPNVEVVSLIKNALIDSFIKKGGATISCTNH